MAKSIQKRFQKCYKAQKEIGEGMRIAIIGSPGSGKSTLASKLHNILNIPLYYVDQYFWKPGWQRPDRDEFTKIHHELCDKDEWIIEGMATRFFDYRAERADVIIFLDILLWLCLCRIFKRAITCFGQMGDSSAKGCPERMPDREFLSYVWNFNRKSKPVIKVLLQKYKDKKKIFVIKNQAGLNKLISKFELGTI